MASEVTLSKGVCLSRLERLYESWNKSDSTKNIDAFIILSGRQDDERAAPKADQLHLWLFGYVFPETLVVLARNKKCYFLAGAKKLAVLKQLDGGSENFIFLPKTNDGNNRGNLESIFNDLANANRTKEKITLGEFKAKSEKPLGAFAEQLEVVISELASPDKYQTVPIDSDIALLLAVHDEQSLVSSNKAATFAMRLAKDVLILRIEDILEDELTEKHSEIVSRVESALDDKKRQEKWQSKFDLDPDCIDIVYANVQSGGNCDLRPSALPTDSPLNISPGTILVAVGSKYQDFTANICRTLLFHASKEVKQTYQFACDALDFAIACLVPGKTFNEVFEAIRQYVAEKKPELVEYLSRSFGHTLSIEFKDPTLNLNGKSTAVIEANMIFSVSIGFANVPPADKTAKNYSVWLADTVRVRSAAEGPLVLTADIGRKMEAVNYEIAEESAPPAKEVAKKPPPPSAVKRKGKEENHSVPANRSAPSEPGAGHVKMNDKSIVLRDRLRSRNKAATVEESEKLLARQRTLRKQKLEELRERFKDGKGMSFATKGRSVRKLNSVTAYRDAAEYPKELKPGRVYVDTLKEAVLVPIPDHGHVPFHVATLRNVFCQAEDKKFHVLRLQFQVPGSASFGQKGNPFPEVYGPQGMFVKELIFKSSNPQMPQIFKSLKDLQKRVKQREETGGASQEIAVQVPLELNRKGGKRVWLKSLMVKTGTQTKRVAGPLEGHVNGLRFSGGRSENIDINYSNIKHAIFQPCENELVVLLHFHLLNPIVVNKKKVVDIQFYTEVGSQTDDLDQRRGRSSYDPDELAEEQREREQRRKSNIEFRRFVEELEELARSNGFHLEFEVPFRELGFFGVPKNSSLLMLPTAKCLVQLTEWPVFVLTLSEVEIVSFERVFHGLRQFDMVFVFKDYNQQAQQITTIPTDSLDTIKRWLNEIDIVWYESKGNLNWPEVLKTIREDIEGFVDDGGFDIFLGEDGPAERGSEEESETDEEDEEFKEELGSGSSEDFSEGGPSGSDSGDSEDESLAEEGSSDASEGADSEEEGLSWDELEKQAIKDDRKRPTAREDNEDSDHRQKRRKNR